MRTIFSSRALLLCAAIFAMALAACAPIFDAARDAAQSMGSPTPNPHVVSERDVTARVLDRRFRDELRKGDPAVKLGHVSCPAADFIEAVEKCTIPLDGVTIPILAQLDVPDKHVDASLGISRVGRGALERDIAVQIESEYGESSKVHCPIPAVIWSIPQKVIACTVDGAPSVGPQVSVQFLDSNRWVVDLRESRTAG